ncbi:MAG: hypothetical protein ACE5HA_18905, partial [Anaerolineae bacterium]
IGRCCVARALHARAGAGSEVTRYCRIIPSRFINGFHSVRRDVLSLPGGLRSETFAQRKSGL